MSYQKSLAILMSVVFFSGCNSEDSSLSAESREQIQRVLNHESELETNSSCELTKELTEVGQNSRTHTFQVSCDTVRYASPRYEDGEIDQVQTDLSYISNHIALIREALENDEIASSDEGSDFDTYLDLLTSMESRLNSRNRVLRSALDSSEEAEAAYNEAVESLASRGFSFEFDESAGTVRTADERLRPDNIDFDAPQEEIQEAVTAFVDYRENLIQMISELEDFVEISDNYSDVRFGDDQAKRIASTESSLAERVLPALREELDLVNSMRDAYEAQILLRGLQTMIEGAQTLIEVREIIEEAEENSEDASAVTTGDD